MNDANRPNEPEIPSNAKRALQLLHDVRNFQRQQTLASEATITSSTTTELEQPNRLGHSTFDWPNTDGKPPVSVGRFEIIRQLGSGGFATVFLAWDPKIGRQIALKIPNLPALTSSDARERFNREARTAGILSHPSIVPVYESGNIGPVSFIAYEYSPGRTLADWFGAVDRRASPTRAARIVSHLADAVEHAHQRGVIHRDLKPANIMVEESDDGEFDRIRITDFGLAREMDSVQVSVTTEGAIVGTPAYMSPEQARGSKDIGPLSDVFSLGVILYELLTGTLPHRKDNHLSTLRAIEHDEPNSLRHLDQTVPFDLEAICLKCLEKSPQQRYQSAFQLTDDLNAFLAGRTVSARRPSPLERFSRWCVKNPALAGSVTFAFLSLAAGLAASTWQWRNAVKSATIAKAATQSALLARDEADDARQDAVNSQQATELAKNEALMAKDRAESANLDSKLFSDFLVNGVMSSAKPVGIQGGLGKDTTVREMLNAMEAAIDSMLSERPAVESKARNAFGAIWKALGDYDKAVVHFSAVMKLKKELGELDAQSLQGTLEFANLLYQRGKLTAARDLLETTIPNAEKALGKDHMLTIGYLNSLAGVLLRQGNLDEAIECFIRIQNLFLEQQGPDHIATQTITVNLAVAYREAGNFDQSILILQEQLDRQLAKLGTQNYQTLRTMTELAESFNFADRAKEAETVLDQALPLAKKLFTEKHPKTIETMLYKARNLQRLGKIDTAVELCKTARRICVEQFDEYHPLTNQCILMLAQLYEDNEDFKNQANTISELIDAHRKHGSIENELRRLPSLAKALFGMGDFNAVERLTLEHRPRIVEYFDHEDKVYNDVSRYWAQVLMARGNWKQCLVELEPLIEAYRNSKQNSDIRKMVLSNWLAARANCLNELGKFDSAIDVIDECILIRSDIAGDERFHAEAKGIRADSKIGLGELAANKIELEESHHLLESQYAEKPSILSREQYRNSLRRIIRMHDQIGESDMATKFKNQFGKLQLELQPSAISPND